MISWWGVGHQSATGAAQGQLRAQSGPKMYVCIDSFYFPLYFYFFFFFFYEYIEE